MIITQVQGPGQIRPPPGNISPQGVFPAPPTEPLTRLALLSLHVSVIPMRRCHRVGPVSRPLPPSCTIPSQCPLPSWAVSTSLTPLSPSCTLGGAREVSHLLCFFLWLLFVYLLIAMFLFVIVIAVFTTLSSPSSDLLTLNGEISSPAAHLGPRVTH